jgi:DNA repair photolyase
MPMPVRQHNRMVKIALRKGLLAEPFSLAKYRLSPYMACGHGCVYCDGRAERYYVDGDFTTDITVRQNLLERLSYELPRLRERGFISFGSGITDIYQPIEKDLGLVRACGELIVETNFPVVLLSKSVLLQRDLDIWQRVNKRSRCIVAVSLVFSDERLRAIFEPGAPPVADRLALLRQCKEAGLSVGVLAMPLLPYLADTEENVRSLLSAFAEIGVDFVVPGSLTLRPGRQKDGFLQVLGEHFPKELARYHKLYQEERRSGAPLTQFACEFFQRMARLLREFGLSSAIPHHLYRNLMPVYDEVHILLHHCQTLYQGKGIDIARLSSGQRLYDAWLLQEKKRFNRRRSLPAGYMDDRLRTALATGEIAKVLNNPRLTEFIRQVVVERQVLDYQSLLLRPET